MSKESQRIAIAEACGWKGPKHPDTAQFVRGWIRPDVWMINPAGHIGFIYDCPDYLHDLNAMHEAEKTLSFPEQVSYAEHLSLICTKGMTPASTRIAYFATAPQRAEAFLRTIGKWVES
ncbi:hypothetical protein N9204_00315 [bacterium]|nr:hypothetical protein [bacterium]